MLGLLVLSGAALATHMARAFQTESLPPLGCSAYSPPRQRSFTTDCRCYWIRIPAARWRRRTTQQAASALPFCSCASCLRAPRSARARSRASWSRRHRVRRAQQQGGQLLLPRSTDCCCCAGAPPPQPCSPARSPGPGRLPWRARRAGGAAARLPGRVAGGAGDTGGARARWPAVGERATLVSAAPQCLLHAD